MIERLKYLWKLGCITWERFASVEGSEAAAAIAFYALFSLFPMFLVAILAFSSAFNDPTMYSQIMGFGQKFFPGSEQVLQSTMDQVVSIKGTSIWSRGGLMGFLLLLWSASSVFAGLVQNINQAWHTATPRHFLFERVIAVGIIFALFLVLGVSVFINTGLKLYLQWLESQPGQNLLLPLQSGGTRALLWFVPLLFSFIVFLFMYRFIPNAPVLWKEAAVGALFATVVGEITKAGFIWWYVNQGAASFLGLYGGVSALAVLMFWIYLYSFIILLGANLTASIAFSTRLSESETATSGNCATV